jgi:hypothetical protein
MVKKKDEKKVVPIAPTVEVPEPQGPTPEEIAEQMRRDEEEMDRRLSRYLSANPMPPTSGVEEQEDEEEETFTLDFDKGIATQKIGEGVAIRNEDGTIEVIEGPVADKIKEVAAPVGPGTVVEPTPYEKEKNRFSDLITERLVSKALASLMERLNNVQKESEKVAHDVGLGYLGERTYNGMYESVEKQKKEIRMAWHGGVVAYDKIPSWAMPWVEDYIKNGLNSLLDFVERD